MNMYKTNCCAIQEIGGLSYHYTAAEAMMAFCKANLDTDVKYGANNAAYNTLYSFYLFTAGVYGEARRNYGKNFANFIKEHKLGTVWASRIVKNRAFHPEHSNQVWIWTPDTAALREWWRNNKSSKTVEPKVK